MRDIDDYRADLVKALPQRAFLRLDRGSALFVSDAPKFTDKTIEIEGFTVTGEGDLVRITPKFYDLPESVRTIMPALLKSGNEQREKLLRQNLAVCLRKKDRSASDCLKKLLYGDDEDET